MEREEGVWVRVKGIGKGDREKGKGRGGRG